MQRIGFFSVLFLFAISSLYAHKHSLEVSKQIIWGEYTINEILPFEDDGHWEDGGVPVYRFRVPLPNETDPSSINVQIQDLQLLPGDSGFSHLAEYRNALPELRSMVVSIRMNTYLEIEIIPFHLADNEISLVSGFTALIEFQTSSVEALQSVDLKASTSLFKSNSVLSSGFWQKISVSETGIYRIPYSTLTSWGFSNPQNVAVYGYGGQMVPRINANARPDDLPEVGILHHNNAIYFYAHGPVSWRWDYNKQMFTQQLHYWSNFAFYFLTEKDSPPKSIPMMEVETRTPTHTITTFDERKYHELENHNILKSGRKWFGEKFEGTGVRSRTVSFDFHGRDVSAPVKMDINVVGRSPNMHSFRVSVNNSSALLNFSIPPVSIFSNDGPFAHEASGVVEFQDDQEKLDVKIEFNETHNRAEGYLDYITINARSALSMQGGQLHFRDKKSSGSDRVLRFRIQNGNSNHVVWDVTDIISPQKMQTQLAGGNLEFVADAEINREYVAFDPSGQFPVPNRVGQVPNQNLHALQQADYVIVVADEFETYAHQLAALHQQHNDLAPVVVPVSQVYNEFSWGHQDPTAIRSLMRMLFYRANGDQKIAPKYLLLFGNGSYDNRSKTAGLERGIVTYQSANSTHQTNTYVTDDYFGFLGQNEGSDDRFDRLDIGIGRFPVNNEVDAQVAVTKVRRYFEEQDPGEWRKLVTFLADDGDFNIHQRDADFLAERVLRNHAEFDVRKIYLDNYPHTSSSAGRRVPEAEDLVNRTISEGTILFNFVGHGGPGGLTEERVITTASINNWTNIRRLPLFVTATCEFGRFDDHSSVSAGERVFLNSSGGGIGLLTTTRVVFSSLNFQLNNSFFNYVFYRNNDGSKPAFGDIIRNTKNGAGSSVNKLNFTLLGDPALKLIYPEHSVNTIAINGRSIDAIADTIQALSKVHLEGRITDKQGNFMENFNGEVDVVVFDKPLEVKTLGNAGATPFEFKSFSSILFRGKATVETGSFDIEFVVPFDIRYNYGFGKISYYARSEQYGTAFGAYENIVVGGFNVDAPEDNDGPQVNMYLNHAGFRSGDVTNSRPMLYADIFDESGINTSGAGIGHDIVLIINGNRNEPIVLNSYFQAKPDTYQEGTIVYQLPELEPGKHEISLRVWDTYNNSTTEVLEFTVGRGKDLTIRDFKWYPNPASGNTTGYFSFGLDEPNSRLNVNLDVISSDGRTVGKYRVDVVAEGNYVSPVPVALGSLGIRRPGLYYIRFHISTSGGKESQIVEKILVKP
ncbi:type IX secretion system sortase PorU [Natronoflexus pectinivorans]|uniref:Peptidase C25-like protein n=1 Tax=Natronoflexus pectinivorans TaxID=682526 RepID=A0A4V2RWR0_9BACT|nr:type IX secretion system sortase PorU [Natronoflexus pectinivorans]TCO09661.1 peptidase C25-like protein [Natronoflexus pectinivorans]